MAVKAQTEAYRRASSSIDMTSGALFWQLNVRSVASCVVAAVLTVGGTVGVGGARLGSD
jgi:hypothetical protein